MPTTSRSSPTTTNAVNEKRRPPLTTLATRLISTTRSWRSSPADETERSRTGGIGRSRLAVSLGFFAAAPGGGASESEPALASAVGERLDAPVVLVSAAVENRARDPGRDRPLGEQPAGPLRLLHRSEPAQIGLGPADRGHRAAGVVVDQLRE